VSHVKYEMGFYIPEDDVLHSHRRKNLKSYTQYECLCGFYCTSWVYIWWGSLERRLKFKVTLSGWRGVKVPLVVLQFRNSAFC
jgi:hypothetical protein